MNSTPETSGPLQSIYLSPDEEGVFRGYESKITIDALCDTLIYSPLQADIQQLEAAVVTEVPQDPPQCVDLITVFENPEDATGETDID